MTRWTIFSLCLLVLLASLAWTTRRMLRMEQQGRVAVAEAEFQERVRLALWRLDAATNPILIRENARPPHHYRAFHSGSEIFSSSFSPLEPGAVLSPSPLPAAFRAGRGRADTDQPPGPHRRTARTGP